MKLQLLIGPKNYSSWSLRPWLCLKWAGIPFEERMVDLAQPGYGKQGIAEILEISRSGRVPILRGGNLVVWDSLAIAEWAAENSRGAKLWPEDAAARAEARAASAEMHSGFSDLRRDLPMNITRRCAAQTWPIETAAQIARVEELWTSSRQKYQSLGPWLFGARSIADAFYAPVATRFRTYSVKLGSAAQAYMETMLDDADFKRWEAGAEPNSWDRPGYPIIDRLYG